MNAVVPVTSNVLSRRTSKVVQVKVGITGLACYTRDWWTNRLSGSIVLTEECVSIPLENKPV